MTFARIRVWALLFALVALLAACQPLTPPTAVTATVPVNDIEAYYEIHGDGPPLILLHGGLGNSDYWYNQIPELSKHYQVIVMDSRGHGRSTFTDQPISYSLMTSDVMALMDHLDIAKADVVGWSDGGIIGLELAINHPDRVNKVIAFGANYNPSGVRADIGDSVKFNAYIAKAAEDYQTLSPAPEKWDAFLANIGNMWATEPNYTPEQLGAITTPMLILDGKEEEAIYTDHAKEMADLIPGATLHLIPGTGHFAMWEKPDEFNDIVLDFLAR